MNDKEPWKDLDRSVLNDLEKPLKAASEQLSEIGNIVADAFVKGWEQVTYVFEKFMGACPDPESIRKIRCKTRAYEKARARSQRNSRHVKRHKHGRTQRTRVNVKHDDCRTAGIVNRANDDPHIRRIQEGTGGDAVG